MDLLHYVVAFGAQHVLHFHGVDDRDGFAGLDSCPSATAMETTSPDSFAEFAD
jgi:hypothetical protein